MHTLEETFNSDCIYLRPYLLLPPYSKSAGAMGEKSEGSVQGHVAETLYSSYDGEYGDVGDNDGDMLMVLMLAIIMMLVMMVDTVYTSCLRSLTQLIWNNICRLQLSSSPLDGKSQHCKIFLSTSGDTQSKRISLILALELNCSHATVSCHSSLIRSWPKRTLGNVKTTEDAARGWQMSHIGNAWLSSRQVDMEEPKAKMNI